MWIIIMLSNPSNAAPTIDACSPGDAPSAYTTAGITCAAQQVSPVCNWDGVDTITCTVSPGCDDNPTEAFVVHDYNATGNHDFSAWGAIDGTKWCCVIDDDPNAAAIVNVVIEGCSGGTEVAPLSFQSPPSGTGLAADNLAPHTTDDLYGFIYGSTTTAGAEIWGSDYAGADYLDTLTGSDGPDEMHGGADKDLMFGGPGDDVMYGGPGNDRLQGNAGNDVLEGNAGHDTLCDMSVTGTETLRGGTGNDKLWLENGGGSGFSGSSNCDGGSDTWGDDSAWTIGPPGCENSTSTRFTTCPAY